MAEIGSFALAARFGVERLLVPRRDLALIFQNRASSQLVGVTAGALASRIGGESSLATMLRRGSERIGETARRAGIATFAAVLLASVVLVICAFRDDFSIAYILTTATAICPVLISSPCCGPARKVRCCSGRCCSPPMDSYCACAINRSAALRLRFGCSVGVQIFFSLAAQLRGASLCHRDRYIPADGNGLNPLLQYPEMVIHRPCFIWGM